MADNKVQKYFKAKSPIKIFVSFHKKFLRPCTNEIIPIHIGRDIAKKPTKDGKIKNNEYQWLINNLIGDNTGDNISSENRKYCELTAQYWVWKHLNELKNTDYIGFMHYRRYFLFNKFIILKGRTTWFAKSHVYYVKTFKNLITFLNLNKKDIYKNIMNYDCLLLPPFDVKNIGYESVEKRFCMNIQQNIERFKIFKETVKELYPQYTKEIEEVIYGNKHILCNMYVLRKDLFEEYAAFLFKILKECDKKFNYSKSKTPEEMRTLAYLGEFIFTIFIRIKKDKLKINYVDGLIYDNAILERLHKTLKLCSLKFKHILD